MIDEEEPNDHAKGYQSGRADLYEWMYDTAMEWYELGITNDKQHIALQMLLHEVDKNVYYEVKG